MKWLKKFRMIFSFIVSFFMLMERQQTIKILFVFVRVLEMLRIHRVLPFFLLFIRFKIMIGLVVWLYIEFLLFIKVIITIIVDVIRVSQVFGVMIGILGFWILIKCRHWEAILCEEIFDIVCSVFVESIASFVSMVSELSILILMGMNLSILLIIYVGIVRWIINCGSRPICNLLLMRMWIMVMFLTIGIVIVSLVMCFVIVSGR